MRTAVRLLGHLCLIVAIGCVMLWLGRPRGLTPLYVTGGLFIAGVVLLSLEEVLKRLTYIECLLENSPAAGTERVKTTLGDFELLDSVAGEATCIGCQKTAAKAGLYYSKSLDVHYHPACLARDRQK